MTALCPASGSHLRSAVRRPCAAGTCRRFAGGCLLVFLFAIGGCVTRDPIAAWQARVEDYIQRAGNGDPNVLRATRRPVSPRADRPARIIIGEVDVPTAGFPPFVETRDVYGFLLGHRRVNDRGWHLFLVAVARCPDAGTTPARPAELIEDIRLAALHAAADQYVWAVSSPSGESLRRYLQARAHSHALDSARRLFPGLGDVFHLSVDGYYAIVTQERSSARWVLRLPP